MELVRLLNIAIICSAIGAVIVQIIAVTGSWWTGATSIVRSSLDSTVIVNSAEVSLLGYTIQASLPPPKGSSILQSAVITSTWSDSCNLRPAPECAKLAAAVPLGVTALIFFALAAIPFALAMRFNPIWLLFGALASILGTFLSLGCAAAGVLAGTSGIGGTGFICQIITVVLGGLTCAGAAYTIGKAMPNSIRGNEFITGRKDRLGKAEAARQREREIQEAMRELNRSQPQAGDAPRFEGSKAPGRRIFMMKRLLEWAEVKTSDEDAVPVELIELAFRELDTQMSGTIEVNEFVESLHYCGMDASEEAVYHVIKAVDKDTEGQVNLAQFIEFFRQLEEINDFERTIQARAAFLNCLCNGCFVAMIIIVAIMLMQYLEITDPTTDTATIVTNLLAVSGIALAFLFVCVICIPVFQFTIGPNIGTWGKHFHDAFGAKKKKMITSQEMNDKFNKSAGVRQAAWALDSVEGEIPPTPTIMAATVGSTYRVSRAMLQQQQEGMMEQTLNPNQGSASKGYGSKSAVSPSKASGLSEPKSSKAAASVLGIPGALPNKFGEFERYDPAAFRQAALHSMEAQKPTSFTPMQVNSTKDPDAPPPPGIQALEYGSAFY